MASGVTYYNVLSRVRTICILLLAAVLRKRLINVYKFRVGPTHLLN